MKKEEQYSIRFQQASDSSFETELTQAVENYFLFQKHGRYATPSLWIKLIGLLFSFIAIFVSIFLLKPTVPIFLFLALVLGINKAAIGFNISHQAMHHSLSPKKWINQLMGLSFNLVGMSHQMWHIKHNVFHHAYTNIYAYDEALKEDETFRFSKDARWKPIHRIQHIYGPIAYAVFTFFWAFWLDFEKFFRYRFRGVQTQKIYYSISDVLIFWGTKLYYVLVFLILPIQLLPYSAGNLLLGFGIYHLVSSTLITHILQVEHVNDLTHEVDVSESGEISTSWLQNQLEGTSNFTAKNKAWAWFLGGVNFQIEHHLFQNVASCHLPELSKIVKQVAEKHQLAYHCFPNFKSALFSHYRQLKQYGLKPTS